MGLTRGRSASCCFHYLDYNEERGKRAEADASLQTPCPDVKPAGYEPHTEALTPKPGLMTGDGDMASTFPLPAKQTKWSAAQPKFPTANATWDTTLQSPPPPLVPCPSGFGEDLRHLQQLLPVDLTGQSHEDHKLWGHGAHTLHCLCLEPLQCLAHPYPHLHLTTSYSPHHCFELLQWLSSKDLPSSIR